MKKHHLFLLVIALLLVAALAFPAHHAPAQVRSAHQHATYNVFALDQIPQKVFYGDTINIKKSINAFSDTQKTDVSFELLQKISGKPDRIIPFNQTPILMKGEPDDQPEPYYQFGFPEPGMYVIRCMPSAYYHDQPPLDNLVEVVASTGDSAPTTQSPFATAHQASGSATIQPVTYTAFSMDEMPAALVWGDILNIKQTVTPFYDISSSVHKTTTEMSSPFEIFQKIPGHPDRAIPFDRTPVWIKDGDSDAQYQRYYGEYHDQPEPYYQITFPEPGNYIVRFSPPASLYSSKSPVDHAIKVVSPDDANAVAEIRDGEDGT